MLKLIFSVVVACLLGTACKKNQTLKVLIASDDYSKVLDPSKVFVASQYQVLDNLTRRLVKFGRGASLELDLAESMDYDYSKGIMNVKLRKNYFSDGKIITADDVVRSYRRVILRGSPHTDPKKIFDLSKGDPFIIYGTDKLSIRMNGLQRSLYYYLQLVDYAILSSDQASKVELSLEDWKVSSGYYYFAGNNTLKKNQFLSEFDLAPEAFELHVADDEKVRRMFRGEFDLCKAPFGYFKNADTMSAKDHSVQIVANGFSDINYINLNASSSQFRKESTRKWIRARIVKNLIIEETRWMTKANQYFLPKSIAATSDSEIEIIRRCNDIANDPIPEELVGGIEITTTKNMGKYHPDDLEARLSSALSIPVKIHYRDTPQQMIESLSSGSHSAYLITNSMSYHEISETLNLLYIGSTREHKDPSGNIQRLITELGNSKSEAKDSELYSAINLQMFQDSENIPLFFIASPVLYNTNNISLGESDFLESLQVWRLERK